MALPLLLFALPPAVVACTARFQEHQRLQTPVLKPPLETYARLLLLREAGIMLHATQPWEWRHYEFNLGACYTGTIASLSRASWRETLTSACDDLARTQRHFAGACAQEGACRVGDEAWSAIQRIIDILEAASVDFAVAEPSNLPTHPLRRET